jgi:heparin binding hemagglutinin HbhA
MSTQTTETTERKIPTALYAAAGVGDLAYQQLRKLPAKVAELRDKVEAGNVNTKVDVDKIREAAKRNAAVLRTNALAAQDRAGAVYADLVARGQQVVRAGRTATSDTVEHVAEVTSDTAVAIAPEPAPVADPTVPDATAKPKKAAPKK